MPGKGGLINTVSVRLVRVSKLGVSQVMSPMVRECYGVPGGSVLTSCNTSKSPLRGRDCYYPRFKDVETEARRS